MEETFGKKLYRRKVIKEIYNNLLNMEKTAIFSQNTQNNSLTPKD